MHTWRMRKKNLCAYGECSKGIFAHMENTHNCGDSCSKISAFLENTPRESMRKKKLHIKNLSLHGECAKRIYVHTEYRRKESMHKWRMHKTQ
jgi:hypothetical protein